MIQRIQSIFLLLAAAAAFALFALPFANTATSVASSALFSDQIFNIQDDLILIILFCLAGGLAFISIFLFKNRKTQLMIGRFAIIANVIGLVYAVILFMQDKESLGDATPNDSAGLYLPIVFLVLALLAQRYIQKDVKLVKSMDRLR